SMGKRQKRTHIKCRRCGRVSFHISKIYPSLLLIHFKPKITYYITIPHPHLRSWQHFRKQSNHRLRGQEHIHKPQI
ncbi:MAG TPA: hypothetical protein EYP53_01045, partial [Candidatus Latescibacteria bacterium]|nr:hypothetical protein [Candidatus Latescibacterota bacterium]